MPGRWYRVKALVAVLRSAPPIAEPKEQSRRRDCSRREATARATQVFSLLSWSNTEATHDDVAYAKRESSPHHASPAFGDQRVLG
jgi:hypothetical protein